MPNEAITDVASGLGADCAKPDSSWCVAAQSGGRHLFVKPKTSAGAPNNIAVVTDRRTHSFRFVVLADRDARQPVYRLSVRTARACSAGRASDDRDGRCRTFRRPINPAELIKERLGAAPQLVNSTYSIAEGKNSEDIVPTLVFDDGRFTYLKLPEQPGSARRLPRAARWFGDSRQCAHGG